MFRLMISGLTAIAIGLVSGWTFLSATAVELSPTTAPALASPGWPTTTPIPSSRIDEEHAPATKAPTVAPSIHTADAPASAAPVPFSAQVKSAPVVGMRDKGGKLRNRVAHPDDDDD
jgi:hypothetical protein